MTRKKGQILLLRHMPGERRDRVSRLLEADGFALHEVNPAHGVALPACTEHFDGMVIYGGSQSVNDTSLDYLHDERALIDQWLAADRPILGLCLGGQLMAQVLGARVQPHPQALHEIGFVPITPTADAGDFLDDTAVFYQWHNEGFDAPAGATLLATGDVYPNQAYQTGSNSYGLQFHPEVTPDIVASWIRDTDLQNKPRPGAHPVAAQLAEAPRHDVYVSTWIQRFLDRWTGEFSARS